MEKLSVTKPFTILVAVIMILVLGVVSLTGMTTDLLPNMSLPYLIVVTTYPGASPERVESDVVKPIESALGTVSGVKNVMSTCAENYGLVQLEFQEGTDMDSTMVKVSGALQELDGSLPELCSTPSIIELSMDMMATMYVSVSRDGYDVYELSGFVKSTVQPFIERQNGVANVTTIGLVQQSVQVELDGKKIDKLNEKILETISNAMATAKEELDKAEAEVTKGKEELEKAQSTFGEMMAGTLFDQLESSLNASTGDLAKQVKDLLEQVRQLRYEINEGETGKALDTLILELDNIDQILKAGSLSVEDVLSVAGSLRSVLNQLDFLMKQLEAEMELPETLPEPDPSGDVSDLREQVDEIYTSISELSKLIDSIPSVLAGLESAYAGLTQAQLEAAVGFATASTQLSNAETQLAAAKKQYEDAKETALGSANLDQLLNVNTLSQLIYAQNFSMPAGYIDDADDNSWLLKIGEEFDTVDQLADTLLVKMDAIGEVRLKDVATVQIIDNAGDSYSRFNGEQAVILSIFKDSVTGTNETAENCLNAFKELEDRYTGFHAATLMNQGSYITIIINSILSSMITGAVLAIIILALFLKDVKPTIVVAVSIPLSVLTALVLMYFTNISLNMMTLSGLSLGVGMLVDNSVVVIENIYRLRSRGVSAPRAAVQGAKQVAGAIIASTLTTVCVFLPMVFTTGMVRELLLPLGLSIGYCLMASLVVALTVVPASASTLLRNSKPKSHPWFDKFLDLYEKVLAWCLKFKAVPLGASVALLGFCVWMVLNMGIVLLPEMTGNQIQVNVSTPAGLSREESYAEADKVIEALLTIDGVDEVGVMDSSSASNMMGGMLGQSGGGSYGNYVFYIALPEGTSSSEVERITEQINQVGKTLSSTVGAAAGGVDDLTAMLGSGLSVKIYGDDLDTLETLANEISQLVQQVEGYTKISTSFSGGEPTIQLVIDKDKAMEKGLTVAQIYMAVSERMNTTSSSTSVTLQGVNMSVTVENNNDPLTLENLLEIEFETTTMDASGNTVKGTCKLSDFATIQETTSVGSIGRENLSRYGTVSASVAQGYNATLLSRQLEDLLDAYKESGAVPYGYSVEVEGESTVVNDMVEQMVLLIALGCVFIYLVMVAQFQSLMSPFIVLFTVPLAFTGGMLGLLIAGQQLSLLSMMGFALLMGTIVNNGIVFVDYTNQLRLGGMDRQAALIATGRTRMRPILMTALTTILAMFQLIFSDDMAGQLGGGMAIVVVGGMLYATLMTLLIVPVIYDIMFKRKPHVVDVGGDNLDDVPDDAAEFIAEALAKQEALAQAQEAENAASEEAPQE